MMAIMVQRGITCEKSAGAENTWVIAIDPNRFSEAVEILKWYGLPRQKFDGIRKVFEKTGLVSSPSEERIRYMQALSDELAQTLLSINGVITARVHIVLPENNPYAENVKPSSAAVFIKHHAGSDVESSIPQVKNLVARSIEGLTYDNVTLALFPSQDWNYRQPIGKQDPYTDILSLRLSPESLTRFWWIVGSISFLFLIFLAGLGLLAWKFWQLRKSSTTPPAEPDAAAPAPEEGQQ